MKKLLLAFSIFVFWGCASTPTADRTAFQTRLYRGSYDQVWLAALKALADYPLKISNKDVGRIHTEVINGPYNDLMFKFPEEIEVPERFRYSLNLRFAKLEADGREPVVRIRFSKDLEKYRDFYTGWVRSQTDGIEEKVILYRIEHILQMDKLLAKQGY